MKNEHNNLKGYADLHNLPENDRIKVICEYLMQAPKGSDVQPLMIGVMVDNKEKADRYIAKINKRYPKVRVLDVKEGVLGAVLIRLGEPLR